MPVSVIVDKISSRILVVDATTADPPLQGVLDVDLSTEQVVLATGVIVDVDVVVGHVGRVHVLNGLLVGLRPVYLQLDSFRDNLFLLLLLLQLPQHH